MTLFKICPKCYGTKITHTNKVQIFLNFLSVGCGLLPLCIFLPKMFSVAIGFIIVSVTILLFGRSFWTCNECNYQWYAHQHMDQA